MPAVGRASVPPRWETWVVALVVPALLAWFAVAVHSTLSSPEPPQTSARSFVPADGARQAVSFTQHGTTAAAMVETSRIEGSGISFAMSPAAFTYLDLPPEGAAAASWWREAVVPTAATSPSRYRIRSVSDAGVWLRVQDWEDLGISFERFLELPGDVAVGQTWSSSGSALAKPTGRALTYRNTSRSSLPQDRAAADRGCLRVDSTTELRGGAKAESWREVNVWCPGRGVVDSGGDFRGSAYAVVPATAAGAAPVTSADLQTPALGVSGLDGWTARAEELLAGDSTFGGDTAEVFTGSAPVVAANGVIAFARGDARDVTGLLTLGPGQLWWHWWVRPGGDVVTMTSIGSLVLVTTTDRRLVAYQAGGGFRWSVELDDVAVVPPVSVGNDRVAVGTVSGEVAVLETASGARLWRAQLDHGVHAPLASDGSVLVAEDTGPTLTAWDASSGHQRWQVKAGSTFTTGLLVGPGEVVLASNGSLTAYDLATGDRRWDVPVGLGLTGISARSGQLWAEVDAGLESRSFRTGAVGWTVPGVSGVAPGCSVGASGETLSFAFRGADLVALDSRGRVRKSWALQARTTDVRSAACAVGRVWVTSYAPDDSTLRVESVGAP
jgi:outer membrane protein assembly factor BamB